MAPLKPPSLSTLLLSNPSSITSASPVPPPASMFSNPPPPLSDGQMTSPGLLPIPFNAGHPVMPDAGMGMDFPSSMMMTDEPFAKKQRMDVSDGLIPEQEFIAQNPVRPISSYVCTMFCPTVAVCMYVCVFVCVCVFV